MSRDKHQEFDGLIFTRDDNTGYYLCATPNKNGKRQRMHVYVWEYYNGKVPDGYHIHHIDRDKSNNKIENLQLLSEHEHLSMHSKEQSEQARENVLRYAIPKASEWHKSEKGRKWHKAHYKKVGKALYKPKEYACQNCGKHFVSTKADSKFCCNNCKAHYRYVNKKDFISSNCVICGKEFLKYKYSDTQTCSRACAGKLRTYRSKRSFVT